jgi:sterol desaturase/sphingolipid hydroxylase (fatty acid hydroxylase superfamily)
MLKVWRCNDRVVGFSSIGLRPWRPLDLDRRKVGSALRGLEGYTAQVTQMNWAILSPALIVSASFLFVGLERLLPYNSGQRIFRKGFFIDLVLYGLVQSWILGQIISYSIRTLDARTGLSRLHLVSGWPLWGQFLLFLVTHDFYIYWFHRAQHASMTLWRIHEAHHSVKDVDWLAGTRSHALEILINQSIEFAPIVLLGAAPDVWMIKATVDAIWGMYIHSNLRISLGAFDVLINGPSMHRWHHARVLADCNANFGTKLGIWDRLFGTAYNPGKRARDYGLVDDASYPSGFLAQQLVAFRRVN